MLWRRTRRLEKTRVTGNHLPVNQSCLVLAADSPRAVSYGTLASVIVMHVASSASQRGDAVWPESPFRARHRKRYMLARADAERCKEYERSIRVFGVQGVTG